MTSLAPDAELFGKFWTWEELQTVERKRGPKPKPDWYKDGQRPANWPADTEPDPGTWVFWLPDGWGQGIKKTSGGKTLKCYLTPEGKRFFHKADIIKYCAKMGIELKQDDSTPASEETLADAVPLWPADDAKYHLPKDWRVAFRKLPTKLHRVYIPPGQNEGFVYHLEDVEKYLAGQKKLSRIEGSKPMVEIMREAGNKDPTVKPKKKRRKTHIITDDDYLASSLLLLELNPTGSLEDWSSKMSGLGLLQANELPQEASNIRTSLLLRGFPETTGLILVVGKGDEQISCVTSTYIMGIYYQKPHESLCYQKVFLTSQGVVACQGIYIFHTGQRWMIGDFAGRCVAFNLGHASSPAELSESWNVLKDDCPVLQQV